MTESGSAQAEATEVRAAYAHCRRIARREAKNFYWAFRVLPRHKSDAMCAVYAFMRKADDLADDETRSMDARRAAMREWTKAWRASRGERTSDPVFLALKDAQVRFGIRDELLEQLVAGTTMDLDEHLPGMDMVDAQTSFSSGVEPRVPVQVYRSFEDLYRYCYLVASVVGLVCIRIFGYSDPHAELLAERTGVAFQLTNILRDVTEDAERGRVYLPLSDQKASGVHLHDLLRQALHENVPAAARKNSLALLQHEIDRARELYRAAGELIPLLNADARPAMRVLAGIYRELLERIAEDPETVFRARISVPTSRKLVILGRGLAESIMARVGA